MAEARPAIMIVGTDCPAEIEEAWNKWYSEKHVLDVLQFKGVRKATRLKMAPIGREQPADYPKYLTIFEFESLEAAQAYYTSPEREVLVKDWDSNWGEKGAQVKWRLHYRTMGVWQK